MFLRRPPAHECPSFPTCSSIRGRHQFVHSRPDVWLLWTECVRSSNPEIPVVETLFNSSSNGKSTSRRQIDRRDSSLCSASIHCCDHSLDYQSSNTVQFSKSVRPRFSSLWRHNTDALR